MQGSSACTAPIHKIQISWLSSCYLESFWRMNCFFRKKLSLSESLFTVPSIVLQSTESWPGGLGRVSGRGNDTAKACSLICYFSDSTETSVTTTALGRTYSPKCLLGLWVKKRMKACKKGCFVYQHIWFDYWHQMSLTGEIIVLCVHTTEHTWELRNDITPQC